MITLNKAQFKISATKVLKIDQLTIKPQQSWAFIGANGSGKTILAKALTNELPLLSGEYVNNFKKISRISFEQLQKLIDEEWQRNNTDLVSEHEYETGRSAQAIIMLSHNDPVLCQQLANQFAIAYLLERQFKFLSTGEIRKVMLCQALMARPDLLILDEPFEGLDVVSRQNLTSLLVELTQQGLTLIIISNRIDSLAQHLDNIAVLEQCELLAVGQFDLNLLKCLTCHENIEHKSLPPADESRDSALDVTHSSIIKLKNGYIHYNDIAIIDGLNWQVNSGEHWQIVGPNGAGKSTLLSLITGDHPQGYSNDLTLFGRKRGSGETIWDIKKNIGYVSSALHADYRVSTSVRNVILSGYFDSIGIYQQATEHQKILTNQWLELLNLQHQADSPFQSLSWGQQRLVLIVRALVKHPTLLILDEPLQGLDPFHRELVQRWIDWLIKAGRCQLLFVSHHVEDAPKCITHRLTFIEQKKQICRYSYKFEKL